MATVGGRQNFGSQGEGGRYGLESSVEGRGHYMGKDGSVCIWLPIRLAHLAYNKKKGIPITISRVSNPENPPPLGKDMANLGKRLGLA